jgi:hypothetical protein
MVQRLLRYLLTLGICCLTLTDQLSASNMPDTLLDYGRLFNYIQAEKLTDPLIVFGDMEKEFNRQLNQENIAYLNANDELLRQIQSHLKGDTLKWRLSGSFKQLLVVPEGRDEYAHLVEHYCREAVSYLMSRLKMPNPYNAIATLKGPLPDPYLNQDKGITAYLVHNIADEYVEEYLFFDQQDDGTQLKIKLSNREFDGKIGSYTSKIRIGSDNQFEFIHEPYTLWQNSAQNPLNVFIVPIEETLHIVLRPATEKAMHSELTDLKPEKLHEVNAVIDHWMAIEEAVVGGLVWQIMPEILDLFMHGATDYPLAETMAERDVHAQYRFLDQGIDLVNRLGIDETILQYQSSAIKFKAKLLEIQPAVESAALHQSQQIMN